MKLSLTIADRLNIQTLIPTKGRLLTMNIAEVLKNKIMLTAKEIEEFEIKQQPGPDGQLFMTWNKEKEKEIEIDFLDCEIDVLNDHIAALDKKSEIPIVLTTVIKKIKSLNEKSD